MLTDAPTIDGTVRSKVGDGGVMPIEVFIWHIKALWSACCPLDSPVVAEVKQMLLDPRLADPEAYFNAVKFTNVADPIDFSQFTNFTSSFYIALANERIGEYERAMRFAVPGCQAAFREVKGASPGVRSRAFYHCMRGRILSKAPDTKAEAAAAFESAITEAQSAGLVYNENLALRDMDRCLRPSGIHERLSAARGKFGNGVPIGQNLQDFNRILDNHSTFF